MRRLLLLRHAKTETDSPTGKDFDRRLDDRGRTDAAALGDWLKHHPPLPDLVCVSTAVRARQTWDAMAAALAAADHQPAVAHLEELYSAGPAELLAVIREAATDDPAQLMIVAHNPGLHELALALVGRGDDALRKAIDDNLPTSGLAAIEFPIDDWGDVAFRGGRLVSFISPKLLKAGPSE